MAEDANVEFDTRLNNAGKTVQSMYFLDDQGKHTRDYYWSLDEASQQLRDNFDFRSGHSYIITYLTNYQWKSGQAFNYIARRTNLNDHVYNSDREIELYNDQAIDEEDLHIYGIVVHQLA